MGFKETPELRRMAAAGQLIDQRTGLPLGAPVPARVTDEPEAVASQPPPPPARPLIRLRVSIPGLLLVSEANTRSHHGAEMRRKKAVRQAVAAALPRFSPPVRLPVVVTITRVGTGNTPLDDDNLARACKGVRDQIAETVLGCDDGDSRIRWRYRQRRGWEPAVLIDIRQRTEQ